MPTVLIVEDNEASRDALTRRLQRRCYDVVVAVDGLEAVSMARTVRPDLILMDLGLPGIDGWDATAHIKNDPDTRHIPIIVLSAHARPNDRHQAIAAGGVISTPPVDFIRLLEKIEMLLPGNIPEGPGGQARGSAPPVRAGNRI
jgi:two-component system response regulator